MVLGGIMGFCVADALGVPVEFENRETLRLAPVEHMRAFGTYNQPAGTWSDDTSMTLCLMDSLTKGLDYNDMMAKFLAWYEEGVYTPFGECFDIGITTREALHRYSEGTDPLLCGGTSEFDNGNGSLMRIFPLAFYLHSRFGPNFFEKQEAFVIIHNISALTHGHPRSQIACGLYVTIAGMMLNEKIMVEAIKDGLEIAKQFYEKDNRFKDELLYFDRVFHNDFRCLPERKVRSSGYVVHTLEAALWCLLNTSSYKECVLMAVNLGEDTDTVAAVAGGLAGLVYGFEQIPKQWLETIIKREFVEQLCEKYAEALS